MAFLFPKAYMQGVLVEEQMAGLIMYKPQR